MVFARVGAGSVPLRSPCERPRYEPCSAFGRMRSRATWICALSAWSLAAAAVSAQSPDQGPPRVPTPDEDFVASAAANALVEIELARMAATRATRRELQEYA